MAKRTNPTAAHRLLVSQGMVQNFLRAKKKKAKLHDFFLGGKKLTSPLLTTLSEKQMCNRFSSIFIHIWVGNHMEPLCQALETSCVNSFGNATLQHLKTQLRPSYSSK